MKVSVFDTYVIKKDGTTMHFDILVPENEKDELKIQFYGHAYLEEKGQGGQVLTSKECRFCHIEQASDKVLEDIRKRGYSIVEMEGCNT
jgi:hypothetical protein